MTVMSWDEWARHDATALAAEVRAGRVTPRELLEQAAEGVARLNPKVNAVIETPRSRTSFTRGSCLSAARARRNSA